ncbi:hypothetical protein PV08_05428 [Exophiala spinifera]|uniref:SMP-30/Gluconolactonase/LRE-like region domain-containing protein n=1 Tax=Exophiala spinifera TaxID=91928 RepID=A0A0D1ZRG5_9EURO|nr:uncharacterized protein PV08_05428 [Exophiala spinifera]KIW15382.1 hypothetical protein PV08_05428 [Exophiala spinifera]
MICSTIAGLVLTLTSVVTASALPQANTLESRQAASVSTISFSEPILEPHIISTFPNGTWIENLVPRSEDGNFVATLLSAPEVYLLSSTNAFPPLLLAQFPAHTAVLGVVELGHDVFYAVVGNFSVKAFASTPGTYGIFKIDLNGHATGAHTPWHGKLSKQAAKGVTVTKVADLPGAGLANGLTVLNPNTGILLVADSAKGLVWSVNVYTGKTAIAVNDPSLAPNATLSGGLSLGINGLSYSNGYLYYDNSNSVTFYRIAVNTTTGHATGPAEVLADQEFANIFPDDFTLDFAGGLWFACEYGHVAYLAGVGSGKFQPGIVAVAGNSTGPVGLTAAKFGTSAEDVKRGSLYVTTNGGPFTYGGAHPAQGQLVRYDTALLGFY